MTKHANISIFVPHVGCKNSCSFCNQRTISGATFLPDYEYVKKICRESAKHLGYGVKNAEIAFFGGSFTAIERKYMLSLLTAAKESINEFGFSGIRCSTRPDAIDDEVLALLKDYGVSAIELGVQSMDDDVLRKNKRGHSSLDVYNASELIKKYNISLGHQIMVGLLGDTAEKCFDTAEKIIKINPDTVRIYPVLVLRDTLLCTLYEQGAYQPVSLDDAVDISSKLLLMFLDKGIKVIKLGLHASELFNTEMVAGPYHPAFKELCENKIYLEKIVLTLKSLQNNAKEIKLFVNDKNISKAVGQNRINIEKLSDLGYNVKVYPDKSLKDYEIRST